MKKLFSALMAFVLATVSVSAMAMTANAAESKQITVVTESNFFPDATRTFSLDELAASDNLVTITYFIKSQEQLLNTDFTFYYPDAGVEVRESDNPFVMPIAADAMENFYPASKTNAIVCNCSNLNGYYLDSEAGDRVAFATVTFRVDGTQDTIYTQLLITDMRFTRVNPGETSLVENETNIVNYYTVLDNDLKYDLTTSIYPGQYDENYQDPNPPKPYVPTRMLGDVNNDGKISINDATFLQRHIAEFFKEDGSPMIDESNPVEKSVADVNFDGVINIHDITLLQRHVSEMTNNDGTPLIDETILF